MSIRILYFTVLFSTTNSLTAEPEIIFDSGRTVLTDSYRKMLTDSQVPDFGESWFLNKKPGKVDPGNPETWFPIITKRMTPEIIDKEKDVYLSQLKAPVCVIGTDDLSMEWAERNQRNLKKMKAQCWLVQANNIKEVRKIGEILKNVPITPANGDAISRYFKIKHYPVLITNRYISQ